jgi:hypothetical protein
MVNDKKGGSIKYSLMGKLGYELNMTVDSVRYTLNQLEARSLVLRTYMKGRTAQVHNPLTRIELVDPTIELPPLPPNPPAIVIMKENEELLERVAHEPSVEDMVMALVDRITELQTQVDKLHTIVCQLEQENTNLKKSAAQTHKTVSQRLTQRVQDALTTEQWEKLRHE